MVGLGLVLQILAALILKSTLVPGLGNIVRVLLQTMYQELMPVKVTRSVLKFVTSGLFL